MLRPILNRLMGLSVALIVLAGGAPARAEDLRFDVLLLGLRAGTLTIEGKVEGSRYNLQGSVESTGILAMIRKVRYAARTTGRVHRGMFVPESYTESTDTGQRFSEAEMIYRGGIPQVKTYRPARAPQPQDVDPSTQGGTLDPLTALFVILRDSPDPEVCNRAVRTFDGRRATRVDLRPAASDDKTIRCTGVYRRVAGYSEKEMADRAAFPFEIEFARTANGTWQARQLQLQTIYGKARLDRR